VRAGAVTDEEQGPFSMKCLATMLCIELIKVLREQLLGLDIASYGFRPEAVQDP
jgi:hypothetical protein